MKKMMKNRKGFTLMEMLIVVAIIAILVIIAIPTFNSALAKARAATDVANIRSGYAAAQVEAMTEGLKDKDGKDVTTVTLSCSRMAALRRAMSPTMQSPMRVLELLRMQHPVRPLAAELQ